MRAREIDIARDRIACGFELGDDAVSLSLAPFVVLLLGGGLAATDRDAAQPEHPQLGHDGYEYVMARRL